MGPFDSQSNANMDQRFRFVLSVALLLWVMQREVLLVVGEHVCRNDNNATGSIDGLATVGGTSQMKDWLLNSDHEDDGSFGFQPWGTRRVTIALNDDLSLDLYETHSSLCSSGDDDTGLVLWGASIALSQYLVTHPETVYGKRAMELGCGSALPSMVSHLLGAVEVVATDFRIQTLHQVLFHSKMNGCSVHVELLDWENPFTMVDLQPDLVIAADVIYAQSHVGPLVKTIQQVLPKNAPLLIAMRDGRMGIPEFRQTMGRNFDEQILVSSLDSKDLPAIPSSISDDPLARDRWNGTFSIYEYRWQHR